MTYWLGALQLSHHPTTFHGHKRCGSGEVMVLACHVISQDHIIRRSCDFIASNLSRWATILPGLVVIATLVVKL